MGTSLSRSKNRALVVFALSVLFGYLGVDRFANGQILLGLLKLVTVGGAGIWWLIDIIIFAIHWLTYPSRGAESAPQARHYPPAPRGEAIAPWMSVKRELDVAGAYYQQESCERIFGGRVAPGQWVRRDVHADLYPDPHNPYSSSGNAVSVWIEGHHIGFIPSGTSGLYSPMLREMAEGRGGYVRVPARAEGVYNADRRSWHAKVLLGLPDPEDLFPRNAIPAGDLEFLPSGRTIQVTGENQHMDVLGPLVAPGEKRVYAATLRSIHEVKARSAPRTVEVQIDGERVGILSPTMAPQVLPLVQLIERAGRVPVVRASVEGNSLSAEVKLSMPRASEADPALVTRLEALPPAAAASTSPSGEPFEWDDQS